MSVQHPRGVQKEIYLLLTISPGMHVTRIIYTERKVATETVPCRRYIPAYLLTFLASVRAKTNWGPLPL